MVTTEVQMTMRPGENQTTADRGAGIEILSVVGELDLTTSEGVVQQGYAAIARAARLLLLDLTGLSFCDARWWLGAQVITAREADKMERQRAAARGESQF